MRKEDAEKIDELLGVDPTEKPKNDFGEKITEKSGKDGKAFVIDKGSTSSVDVSSELGILEKKKAFSEAKDTKQKVIPKVERAIKSKAKGEDENAAGVAERNAPRIAELDTEEQIEKLVEIAKSRGVEVAVKTAKNLSNYVLDKTHGELTEDKLHEELIKQGLIKEI